LGISRSLSDTECTTNDFVAATGCTAPDTERTPGILSSSAYSLRTRVT
jgi:hypothetical protein